MKDFIHVLLAGVVGALAAYFNVLAVPLVVLVAVMLIDYVTGMAAASYTKQLNSRVGGVIDYLIASALVSIGIHLQINYCFGMIITVWLIINELISILENLGEMGVPLPSFLTSMIKTLKGKVEEQGGKHYHKEDEHESD